MVSSGRLTRSLLNQMNQTIDLPGDKHRTFPLIHQFVANTNFAGRFMKQHQLTSFKVSLLCLPAMCVIVFFWYFSVLPRLVLATS